MTGDGVWRVWKVLEGLEGLEGFGRFGAFAGGQTAALKAHRKPLLWPWPWGACWGSGLGPGVPAGEGVWRVWTVLESVWRVLEGLEGFGGWSDRTSFPPAVVPGAAPALAKAGVGGYNPLVLGCKWNLFHTQQFLWITMKIDHVCCLLSCAIWPPAVISWFISSL